MTGYIKLHRQILEWEWYSDINTKILFLHILLKANFKNMVWRGININRGQLFTSITHLSSEIGISEKKIRTSLKKLKNTNEIDIQGASNGTMITVCNYETYQSLEISEGEQMASERANEGQAKGERRANEGQQRKKNNKDKKENKENNTLLSEIKISDVPEENKQFYTIALTFHDIMQSYLTKLKIKSTTKHTYEKWISVIRLMFENDKRTVEEFREVAEYLKKETPDNNGFSWQANIRSADTLRKHFEKVLIKSRQMKLAKKESSTYRKTIEPNLMEI